MKKFILFLILLSAMLAKGQKKNVYGTIDESANRLENKMITWRRDFHEHPELSNREFRTGKIIADHLRSLGIEVKEGVAKTGVVGILRGAKPGPCIGLRADIDALPIVERPHVSFASTAKSNYNGQEVGVMHACGHDSHIAMLMTVAEILAGMKDDLKGTVKFIFQPAEEGPPEGEEGGAALMVKEGVLENPKVEVLFGMHIWSSTEVGNIEYRSGSEMAASDWFTIKVTGRGTHGAEPWLGVDPVVISAQIIEGLQSIVSRQMDIRQEPAVLSVCVINGGVRSNVIPEEVTMTGTIRTLDKGMREQIHQKVQSIATHIAEASGAKAEVRIAKKTEITYNNPTLVAKMLPTLTRVAGDGHVIEMRPKTGSEDFSFFAQKVPSFYFFLGGMEKGKDPLTVPAHHTADFVIDESGFKLGVRAFCNLVVDYMNNAATATNKKM